MEKTAVDFIIETLAKNGILHSSDIEHAKAMEKEQIVDFGEFIIDELEPMSQNRDWVEERYNYFKSE